MQIVIDIPEEQVKKSLEESKYINEDEGEKGSVHIVMLYTNAQLEFVDVARNTDFYSCKYKILPKGHGRLIDADKIRIIRCSPDSMIESNVEMAIQAVKQYIDQLPTIIESEDEK